MKLKSYVFGAQKQTQAERIREGYIQLAQMHYRDYHLTLTAERSMSPQAFADRLKGFFRRVDTKLLGRNAHLKPMSERSDGIVFLEHVASNIHGHAVLNFGGNRSPALLRTLCEQAWAAVCPGGSALLEIQDSGAGAAVYSTKEMKRHLFDYDGQIVMIADLVSAASR